MTAPRKQINFLKVIYTNKKKGLECVISGLISQDNTWSDLTGTAFKRHDL